MRKSLGQEATELPLEFANQEGLPVQSPLQARSLPAIIQIGQGICDLWNAALKLLFLRQQDAGSNSVNDLCVHLC